MKDRSRRLTLLAVLAIVGVAALSFAIVPEAVARPCPPPSPPGECTSCKDSDTLPDGTICYLIDCLKCGKTICRYECSF